MEKDVVCGMQVDPSKAAGNSEYNGRTFYFCSPACKTKFDANPAQYAGEEDSADRDSSATREGNLAGSKDKATG